MGTATPAYWIRAKRALARRDPVLARIIRDHPRIALEARGEPFFTLARAIVGQQISVKAASSIWTRVVALAPRMLPGEVVDAGHPRLLACGLSRRKAEYLAGLARHFVAGSLHVAAWADMEDEAVIAELVQVRGIGRWTAEMFLMFQLGRLDVWPVDDYGVRKGWAMAHKLKEPPPPRALEAEGDKFRPYRSIAALYCWRAVDTVL
jgi:DNA-3-methyladenine glycosylase II